jgi:hypothetical protein
MKQCIRSHAWLLTVALMASAAGCGRDGVKVYHVDTNDTATPLPPPPTTAAMPPTMPAGLPAPDNSGLPPLKYTLPAGWQQKPVTEMRVASFAITENGKQADVSVIPLGGWAGGDLANVNRWLGQVGQNPVTEAELPKLAEKVQIAGQSADLYDLAGESPGSGDTERILAAVLHRDDTAWFFKMTGDGDLVEKNKAAFTAFLKSVEFGAAAPAAAMDLSQLPPSHPAIPGMDMANVQMPAPDAAGKPAWTIPAGWQEGPLAQFLVAKFIITGADGAKAEVNVSSLAGDGGGLLANLNRWRAQLGQPAATEADIAHLPTIDTGGGKATEVEISGVNPLTGKPARLIGLVLSRGGQTWFYKLMGDAEVVAQQRDALVKFVQSAQYP